jgi:NADPH:quinone reductase-like Zn-dependent oxidoreductase/acyl carrier protein
MVAHAAGAGLWGLHAAVAVEHPEFGARAIDMDPDAPDFDALALELLQGESAPGRVALRAGGRLAPRLVARRAPAAPMPHRLVPGADGTLDGLQREAIAETALAPDEVRLDVVATGLNFRDVLIALGMVPRGEFGMGVECAGIVAEVGAGVRDLAPGDRVFGFTPGSLGTQVDVPAAFLARWPAELGSLEQAAALPAAYLTAMLGLDSIAGLRRGQTVLVHAGTGGVGTAAVHLALRAGARVFATAGTPAKRARLLAMGVEKAFDSRTLDFSAQVREATGGAGVDVVLNSLADDFIGASVEALGSRGCFLELGKRELWSAERFRAARPQARYEIYDLGERARADPAIVRPMLDAIVNGLRACGTPQGLPLLPVRVFDLVRAPEALRFMAQARHVGKLVVRMPGAAATEPLVRADATYLITGGLGAIGLHAARWLVAQGARHVVLAGRGAPSEGARAAMDAMRASGAQVSSRALDAADAQGTRALLDEIAATMPPLRGVIHAAGALDDGILVQQDAGRFARVLRGKAHGARVLDALTRPMALDFFVMFSAAGLLLGPAGQGAYAAANAELDAIAHARRAAGLPALSVAWGMWSEGGMASAMAAAGRDTWSARGLGWIAPADGLARLERLLREGAIHAAVMPMDWRRFLASLPAGADRDYFAGLAPAAAATTAAAKPGQGARIAAWKALAPAQRRESVRAHAAEQALAVLGLGAGTVLDPKMALKDAGLDSLMAVELRNALARSTGHALPATLLFDHPSLDALTTYLLRALGLADEAAAAPAADATREQREAIAQEVEQMSDAEAEALLLAELDGDSRTGS